jgi:hypothetical protein
MRKETASEAVVRTICVIERRNQKSSQSQPTARQRDFDLVFDSIELSQEY